MKIITPPSVIFSHIQKVSFPADYKLANNARGKFEGESDSWGIVEKQFKAGLGQTVWYAGLGQGLLTTWLCAFRELAKRWAAFVSPSCSLRYHATAVTYLHHESRPPYRDYSSVLVRIGAFAPRTGQRAVSAAIFRFAHTRSARSAHRLNLQRRSGR